MARTARLALTPASWLFGAVVAARNAGFDRRRPPDGPLPAISIGNLSVGGTGKTPMAAWCVQRLRERGARPAVVLRGVGDDEWRVHGLLNPGVPVVVSPDRLAGMGLARARGAGCVVLDDAFQHRQAPRVADVVLVSADRWRGTDRLLPAGPFRESLRALRRADVAVITAKAATDDAVERVWQAIAHAAPDVPCAVARLVPGPLRLAVSVGRSGEAPRGDGLGAGSPPRHRAGGPREPMLTYPPSWLAGKSVAAVSALGDPASFERQLEQLGATVRVSRRYPDHRTFTSTDAESIARDAEGTSGVICTLKDAVKLGAVWPREGPVLWYLSQTVVVDRGAEALDRLLDRLLVAPTGTAPTAG